MSVICISKTRVTWKSIYFHMLEKIHISVCHVLKVSSHDTISRDMVLFIQEWKHLTAACVENHLMTKATYSSTWGFIQVKSLTSVPHVNRHSCGRISCWIICLCIWVLCTMQGMIWEDTDALFVGIYTLLSWIYCHMNKLMLLTQNSFSVKNIEMLYHTILSHCIPVRDCSVVFQSEMILVPRIGDPLACGVCAKECEQ